MTDISCKPIPKNTYSLSKRARISNTSEERSVPMNQLSLFATQRNGDTFSKICAALGCEGSTPGWPDAFGRSVSQYLRSTGASKIRTLSLFSGAGGLDIGFSDVGFEIVESVEIERKFCDTLEINSGEGKRFGSAKVNCIDIREYSGAHLGRIDFIIGGPPCQTFSAAGRRANGVSGTTDARGVLFREYVRLLRELSPVGFLFENVYGIIGAQGGAAWKEILDSFSAVGYRLYYRIIDAADYGTPQHRERLLIVGLRDGVFKFPRPTHGPDSLDNQPFYTAGLAVAGADTTNEEGKLNLGGRYGHLLDDIPPGLNYSFYTEEMGHPNPIFAWRSKFSDFLYKADPDTPVRTIKASGGAYTGPFHWENRFFSCDEFKRLQSFPDDYQISGSKQTAVKQVGNSVPPQLARMMAIAIREQVFSTSFPFTLSLLEADETLTFRKRKRELTESYRRKAETAIAQLRNRSSLTPASRTYFCNITENFNFQETVRENADYRVRVQWDSSLLIDLHPAQSFHETPLKMHIDLTPSALEWALPVDRVVIDVFAADPPAFTAAWKAFEQELVVNTIKADLVQLNGYYQYVPKLRCSCILNQDFPYRNVVESIVAGEHVSKIVSQELLSDAWGIPASEVVDAAEFHRRLGYEIRNHMTNPQIAHGYWLIPYAFPTLTPLSVQLRKKVQ